MSLLAALAPSRPRSPAVSIGTERGNIPAFVKTIVLLVISNVWMTFAWYGHLKFKEVPVWKVILASWLIAGLEYCFQVPANRLGHNEGWTASQLKITQEAITLAVFCIFATIYLGEKITWNYYVAFALILLAVCFAVWK